MKDDEKELVDALDLSLFRKLRLAVAVPVMKEIITRFWTDPAYFTGIVRALAALLAGQILSGQIVIPGKIGQVAWFLATWWGVVLAVPAGQTNQTPSEIKVEAHDPQVPPSLSTDARVTPRVGI